MVPVVSLLVPILLGAVHRLHRQHSHPHGAAVHKNDLKRLPNEDARSRRATRVEPASRRLRAPLAASMGDMKSPAFIPEADERSCRCSYGAAERATVHGRQPGALVRVP